jgi:hypothetical protein
MKKTILLLLALFMIVFACGYTSAAEKFTPAGIEQGPEIFVQLRQNFCDKVQLKV